MKKIFLIVFFVLMIAGQGFACDYCRLPLSLKQGCDEVALRVGGQSADCRKKFLREMVTGFHQGGAAVLPPGTKFAWTVDNDGFARQTFRLSQKQDGRVYPANVCGKEIAFFYPSDNSFLFGLTIGKPSGNFSTAAAATTIPIAYQPSVKSVQPSVSTTEEKKYYWDGTEVEVPPMGQQPEKKSAPKTTQKKGGKG